MLFGSISGYIDDLWQVVHDSGEFTGAVTSYDITGLDGDTDEEYQLITRIIGNAAAVVEVQLNDDTGNNYGRQLINGDGAVATAGQTTGQAYMEIGQVASGTMSFSNTRLSAVSGLERFAETQYASGITGTTVGEVRVLGTVWSNTIDNVVSLKVVSSAVSGLGVGSRVVLLKKVSAVGMRTGVLSPKGNIDNAWQKIYETTLGSAVTTVNITGLDGNTDVLYRLVSRTVSAAAADCLIRLNNVATGTYGSQLLRGLNASIYASRDVAATHFGGIGGFTGAGQLAVSDRLMYVKNGYGRAQVSAVSGLISGLSIGVINIYGRVWSDTSANVTSIDIVGSVANSLGIGTQIELYKLNL